MREPGSRTESRSGRQAALAGAYSLRRRTNGAGRGILRRRCSKPWRVVIALVVLSAVALAVGASSAQVSPASSKSHGPGARGYSAFAIDPQNPRIVYVGAGFGILKSSDGGETWQAANDGLREQFVMDLAISQSTPTTLYAATPAGVFKSTNGANQWTKASELVLVGQAVHPRNRNIVYGAHGDVSKRGGIFKSSDGGRSWRKVAARPRVFAVAIDPKQPSTVYAGAGSGVFKSTNGGRSWRAMNRGLFATESPAEREHRLLEGFVLGFAINPRNSEILYVATNAGVFKSTNGARTWHPARNGLGGGPSNSGLVGSVALDPRDPRTLYAGTFVPAGVYKSTNAGGRWKLAGPLPRPGYVLALAVDPQNPQIVYAGTTRSGGGEAYKSTDGGRSWRQLPLSLNPRPK
jgi:photosystem II stability/assembly factor-like uncharacterized protein